MLRTLSKGWHLCCYKYWPRNFNIYPNIYSGEGSLLFRGNSKIQFNHKKPNKQGKTITLMKLSFFGTNFDKRW